MLPKTFPTLFRAMVVSVVLLALCLPPCRAGDIKVIAAVMSSDQPRYREAHRAFVNSMAARGYTTANTQISLYFLSSDSLICSTNLHKINASHPRLIVAYGAQAAQIAMKEGEGRPVVAIDAYDAETPAPGTCGVSSRVPMIALLKTLQDIGPYRRIGVLIKSRDIGSLHQAEDIRKYASQLGMSVVEGNATAASLDSVLATLLDKADVIFATESNLFFRQFDRITARARSRRIPVLAAMPRAAERGALASLEINPQEQGHLGAEIATRILEGAHAEHLSLLTPRQIDLVINLRAARQLGIHIPKSVAGSATRIVQ
ncbi:MAG TPA: ABC transporter substrate binding protein [Geobacteraceae bacterium]